MVGSGRFPQVFFFFCRWVDFSSDPMSCYLGMGLVDVYTVTDTSMNLPPPLASVNIG